MGCTATRVPNLPAATLLRLVFVVWISAPVEPARVSKGIQSVQGEKRACARAQGSCCSPELTPCPESGDPLSEARLQKRGVPGKKGLASVTALGMQKGEINIFKLLYLIDKADVGPPKGVHGSCTVVHPVQYQCSIAVCSIQLQ